MQPHQQQTLANWQRLNLGDTAQRGLFSPPLSDHRFTLSPGLEAEIINVTALGEIGNVWPEGVLADIYRGI